MAIVEQAPLPACLLDPRGCVVAANRRLEELLGAAGGGLLGRSLGSLAYSADAGPARNALASVLAQGLDRALVDVRCPRLDNEELRYSAWDLSPVRHRRGRTLHALAVVRDLTEAMRSEHERRFFEFLLKVILDGVAVTVDVARTGGQALDYLRRGRFDSRALPGLVLLDLGVPRMDGLEVLGRIRADASLRSLPVVMLTSSEREEDREQALRLGATWYVCKPIDGARFRAEVP